MADKDLQVGRTEIAIAVRDLDTMAQFYGQALGLPHVGDLQFVGGKMRRYAWGDSIIKLLLLDDVPNQSNPAGGLRAATGLRCLAIRVDDTEAVAQRCEAAGARIIEPIQKTANGTIFTVIEDPEGNCIELANSPSQG